MATTTKTEKADVYEIVTNQIIEMLQQGTVPWRKPWTTGGPELAPRNLISNKPYTGINIFLLGTMSHYDSPYWLTYKQATERGGTVRKGEKSSICVFWKKYEKEDPQELNGKKEIRVLRYYRVFNVEQCEGITAPEMPKPDTFNSNPIEAAEAIQLAMPNRPVVQYGGNSAFYRPSTDSVFVPERNRFEKPEEFYSTLFHELAHSTGHESRLNRPGITEPHRFGSANYSKEELIAEMTAAFLCAHCSIETATLENSAAYIQGWINALKGDHRLAITAASAAQKAANYILNGHQQPAATTTTDALAPFDSPDNGFLTKVTVVGQRAIARTISKATAPTTQKAAQSRGIPAVAPKPVSRRSRKAPEGWISLFNNM